MRYQVILVLVLDLFGREYDATIPDPSQFQVKQNNCNLDSFLSLR